MLSPKARSAAICLALAIVTFAVFAQVFEHDFVNFDDQKYVTENPTVLRGWTSQGIAWAFTHTEASNWHPLTWLSHMLDIQLFGLHPGWHHLINLLLHTANTCLLFLALRSMTGAFWRCAFVAALFGLHPLHVESVAWIAERKDVLSAFFFMLTLWTYARYAEAMGQRGEAAAQDAAAPKPRAAAWAFYGFSLLLFAFGLMSKPMLVTVPFVLLLLDYWPLRRIELIPFRKGMPALWTSIREKIPFFILSAASCILTVRAQQAGGAVASLELVPFGSRLLNALTGYLAYMQKMIWPADLAVLYLPAHEWPPGQVLLAVMVLAIVTVIAVWLARSIRYLPVGWFWFLGMLMPVIGFVQVGGQWIADRYTYLPLIGLFICLSWGAEELTRQWPHRRLALGSTATIVLALLAAITNHQLRYWSDSERLFTHCLAVSADNCVAHNNLGNALVKKGAYATAEAHYREALRIHPHYPNAMLNLGVLLTQQGRIDEAVEYLRETTRLGVDTSATYAKLGLALEAEGKFTNAIAYYQESLRLKPDQLETCNNLAWILATHPNATLRNGVEAIALAERACRLSGYQMTLPLGTLAAAYAEAGKFNDAAQTAEKAIQLASRSGQDELAKRNRELLELYRAGKPYHESGP